MLRTFNLILISIVSISFLHSQSSTKFRNSKWKPNQDKYFFSTVYTFSFQNELAQDEHLKSGEMSYYVDEITGTFLFTSEAYGVSGEMIDFIIGDTKGVYMMGYTDEDGKKKIEKLKAEKYIQLVALLKQRESEYKKINSSKSVSKTFGKNKYGWPVLNGKLYNLKFLKTNDLEGLYHCRLKYSQLPLYLFNDLGSDARLPIAFDYSNVLPSNVLVLGSDTNVSGKKISFELKSISPTEYYIDLSKYTKVGF